MSSGRLENNLLGALRIIIRGHLLVKVGRIRARRLRVGRIKGFIGAHYGCESKVEVIEGR